jgi:hypothetical protein
MKRFISVFLFTLLLAGSIHAPAFADDPSCTFEADGSITCTVGGGGDGGNVGGGDDGDDGGEACVPGQHLGYEVLSYDAGAGTCEALLVYQDNCTGQMIEPAADEPDEIPCAPGNPVPPNPCDELSVSGGGITCEAYAWDLKANVRFPEIYLDVRPYPATLVRWDTTVRSGSMGQASGSDGKDYIPYGGGSPGNPREGDWSDLRLILTLRPAGMLYLNLPYIGDFPLASGASYTFAWEVPSHPAAGGGPLAGSIAGLDELPSDMPLFVGYGRAPYRLYWELRYLVYESIKECFPGPNANGRYNCDRGTGHKEIVDYEWRRRSQGGEIPPSAVRNLPASVMADLNNDGTADAYWDNNLTLRRMDNAGSISNPLYQRSWSWGGTIYWAVREGQGQIGWPGY